MSRHAEITTDWADGTYTFRLGLEEIEELEAKFDRSIFVIVDRLRSRTATSGEILETIRVGLIGGGAKPGDALALKRRYGEERPLDENRDVAYLVGLAGLTRVHGDEVSQGEADAPETSRNDSTSGPSGETQS